MAGSKGRRAQKGPGASRFNAMPELQVLNGSLQWKTVPVGGDRFLIGRKDTCHLVLKDPRIPIEYGAGMSTFTPDGVQTVHGSPIRLQRRGEGIILLDAGYVTLSEDPTVHGPHPSLGVDLESGAPVQGGHRHHMRAINAINRAGGLRPSRA